MKVRRLLALLRRAEGRAGRDVEREIDRWLERLDLAKWAHHRIDALSKGMSQKVQFIATVDRRPELVILDEPFSGLDPVNEDVLRDARPRAAAARRDGDLQHARHERGREDVRPHLHDLQGQEGARRHARRDPGAATAPTPSACGPTAGRAALAGVAGRRGGERLRQPAGGAAARGSDPQAFLARLVARAPVHHFEVTRPSLHDIFVRIAQPDADAGAIAEVGR